MANKRMGSPNHLKAAGSRQKVEDQVIEALDLDVEGTEAGKGADPVTQLGSHSRDPGGEGPGKRHRLGEKGDRGDEL